MKTLNRKLLRDLRNLKGQVLTIALVVACGIASYVTMQSTWTSLKESKESYFERYHFADVFVSLKRAPRSLVADVRALPGVSRVYDRVVHMATVPIPSLSEVARAYLISLPDNSNPPLNGVFLRSGRFPSQSKDDEAVVVESFAKAHKLTIGDHLPVVLAGKLRQVQIVGIGLSPEYVFLGGAGDFVPDDKQIAALWMKRSVLAPAFQMDGAFNDLSIDLEAGADAALFMRRLDLLLEPYGGLGSIPRDKQISSFLLDGELAQLEQMATVVPIIFLAVAAFLLNIVLGRLIFLQRQQIAALKALGYGNRAISLHYLVLGLVVVLLGSIVGLLVGAYMGHGLTGIYGDYFRFPNLLFRIRPQVAITAIGVSVVSATAGALFALRQITKLSPAEAMRPAAPPRYKRGLLDKLGLQWIFGVSSTMVLRELRRRPVRLFLSSLGIAAAVGIMVVGRFGTDSMTRLIDVIFHQEQKGEVSVIFLQPKPMGIEHEFELLPGVLDAEGLRIVPARIRSGPRWRDSVVNGIPREARLRGITDRNGQSATLPDTGLLLSAKLAEILMVEPGDLVELELREGDRKHLQVPIAAVIDDAFGLQGYMNISDLHRRMNQEKSVSLVQLRVDPEKLDELRKTLKEMPAIAQVTVKASVVKRFQDQSAKSMQVMTYVLSFFGAIIAIGVVYNNARVTLSIRGRDFASMRVLGFSQREVSGILIGELTAQILLGIPIGLWLGNYWSQAVMSMADPETYRFSVYVSSQSYLFAIAITLLAAVISAVLLRLKISKQDLISVLKTRE